MGIGTLLRYLIGDRAAILEIAANRWVLVFGGLFVLSAGFAREYDGEDLWHEPWHLLIPFGASLLSSFILFMVSFGHVIVSSPDRTSSPQLANDPDRPSFVAAYLSFLALFWMTAPLAWLYAIPYERFLSPPDAVEANLWTLGLVALWRVALMVRVLSVLMGYSVFHAIFLVMGFADAVALLAIQLMPRPLFDIMGGIRLTESERVILNLTCMVTGWGCVSLPVWLIGTLVAWANSKPAWQVPLSTSEHDTTPGRGLRALAVTSLIVWAVVLP